MLASVPPGRTYRLVGIVQGHFGGAGRRTGRHGKGHGHAAPVHGLSGRNREMLRRLMDLGLTRGCVFEVVQGGGHGPVLIEVRGTRIALGHRLARKLLVEEVPKKK